MKILLGIVGAVILLAGCGAILSAGGDTDNGGGTAAGESDAPEEEAATSEVTAADSTDGGADDGAGDDSANDESDASGAGLEMGSRESPLPYDQPVELTWNVFGDADGSVWTTSVGRPRDITEDVLAANQFNEAPPEGVRFVGFDVDLTLVESTKEPLAPAFNYTWEIIGGATARAYDQGTIDTDSFGCGVVEGEFDSFAEAFVGGTLSGTVCIPLPADDLDHPETRVALHFVDDNRAFFGGS